MTSDDLLEEELRQLRCRTLRLRRYIVRLLGQAVHDHIDDVEAVRGPR